MPIESANYIAQLNTAYPLNSDKIGTGARHIRLLKKVLLQTLPNANATISASPQALAFVNGLTSDAQTQLNTLYSDIRNVSASLRSQLTTAENNAASDRANLSAALSARIDSSSAAVTVDIRNTSANLATQINSAYANTQADIANTSASLATQIDNTSASLNAQKLNISATAVAADRWGNSRLYYQTATPVGLVDGDIWMQPE